MRTPWKSMSGKPTFGWKSEKQKSKKHKQ
jgi:hypothetical protein